MTVTECTAATSVACECVFSTSGGIVNARRNRLTAENVDMLTFLAKICRPKNLCAYTRLNVVAHGQLSDIFQLSPKQILTEI